MPEDPSAADGGELVPVTHERDPGTHLIRDRQQSACGVLIEHPGLIHQQQIAGLEPRPRRRCWIGSTDPVVLGVPAPAMLMDQPRG
jgi:hypothetical protein